ncbi:MAG: MBL fold metallo-hydrolase [Gammaproteobacteria bacterium]
MEFCYSLHNSRLLMSLAAIKHNYAEPISMQTKTKISRIFTGLALAMFTLVSATIQAKEPVPIEVSQLTDRLYVFTGHGGNVLISKGDDGVFMVDDQYPTQQGPIRDALETLSIEPPKFLLNTHWHGDHAGGNQSFASSGALIFAHENVRRRLSTDQVIEFFKADIPAAPDSALPVVTFSDRMSLHLNGDKVMAIHAPNAHTDGDALIYFHEDNVLHTGDVFFENMFPFIDSSSGGTIGGMIAAIELVLPLINDETQIVPGHGPVSDLDGLQRFRSMLKQVRKSIAEHILSGDSLEQVIAARPTKKFDEKYGGGFLKPDNFVRLVYDNIVRTTLR